MSQTFISDDFLATLFRCYRESQVTVKRKWTLVVSRPEETTVVDLSTSIITYSPEQELVVIHEGVRTIHIRTTNWNSIQAVGGVVWMKKEDVSYRFEEKKL